MLKKLTLTALLLAMPATFIKPDQNMDIDYETVQHFIKNLSIQDALVYETIKAEKGVYETLQFLNSPNYQLFKLCQKNDCDPCAISQKTLELLNQGADPNFSYNNLSLIRLAAINGQEEMVTLLLERGSIPIVDDIEAISLKLNILATCQEDDRLRQDDSYPGVSFEHDKQKFLNIEAKLKERLALK